MGAGTSVPRFPVVSSSQKPHPSTALRAGFLAKNEKWGHPASYPGRGLTIGEIGALSDFDDIAVRIADVAANLPVFCDRGSEELGSSTFP